MLDDRIGSRSTLITSQLPVKAWHTYLDDPTLADAILERLLVFRQPSCPEQPTQRPTLVCRCCGAPMTILKLRIPPTFGEPPGAPARAQELST